MDTLRSFLCAAFVAPTLLHATQWQVGPGETYTAPSQVASLVGNGDTVNIAAGTYPSDVTNWTANNLLLRGVGGMAYMESNGNAWGGKAIWVIQGDSTTVEWIEFSECAVPDHNGAGIRQEGHNLTVRHCYFHDNDDGILTDDVHPSTIRIEHTEFDHNGSGDTYSHNLYINHVDSLIFRYNYCHNAYRGHELKSRANVNLIEYNRFSNETTGQGIYNVDLSNGGQAYLIGNVLQQGPMAVNGNMVGFGLDGLSNPGPHEFYAINNTLVNEKTTGAFFNVPETVLFKVYSNILAGNGNFMVYNFPTATDTAGNLRATDISSVSFAAPDQYDHELVPGSPAQLIGVPAGLATSGYPLVALDEYVHPTDFRVRCQQATLDAGAYQLCTTGIEVPTIDAYRLWPNPTTGVVHFAGHRNTSIQVIDAMGRTVLTANTKANDTTDLSLTDLPRGPYTIVLNGATQPTVFRLVLIP